MRYIALAILLMGCTEYITVDKEPQPEPNPITIRWTASRTGNEPLFWIHRMTAESASWASGDSWHYRVSVFDSTRALSSSAEGTSRSEQLEIVVQWYDHESLAVHYRVAVINNRGQEVDDVSGIYDPQP